MLSSAPWRRNGFQGNPMQDWFQTTLLQWGELATISIVGICRSLRVHTTHELFRGFGLVFSGSPAIAFQIMPLLDSCVTRARADREKSRERREQREKRAEREKIRERKDRREKSREKREGERKREREREREKERKQREKRE